MRKKLLAGGLVMLLGVLSLLSISSYAQQERDFMEGLTESMLQSRAEQERTGQEPVREIINVSGDLYRYRNGGHYGIFLVTAEGIILVDPVSTDASRWLKAELDERFGVPVRYLIYSHFHYDHIEGGDVFADTAEIVAHENMLEAMNRGVAQTLPGATYDTNGNAVIEFEESVTGMRVAFDRLDRNGDGLLTGAEMFAEIPPPDIVYSDRKTITLGGKTVELVHPGPNHSYDMTVVLFPEERTIFAVDFVNIGGLALEPFFDRIPLSDWVNSLKAVEALDFDIAALGHGNRIGTKADVVDQRRYFENLVSVVSSGMAAGNSVEDLEQSTILEEYKDWNNYDMLRSPHIAWAYENLTAYPLSD